MAVKFTRSTTSDDKRLVRAAMWELAAKHIRHVSTPWLVTLAGHNPGEELHLMRTLIPGCRILAVDKDRVACQLAKRAGADEVMCGDVFDWTEMSFMRRASVVNLDLCGQITDTVVEGVVTYSKVLKGALMLTFSYGRDGIYFGEEYKGVPSPLGGRVKRVDTGVKSMKLRHAYQYKGNRMAMCSLLWS